MAQNGGSHSDNRKNRHWNQLRLRLRQAAPEKRGFPTRLLLQKPERGRFSLFTLQQVCRLPHYSSGVFELDELVNQ